MLKSIEWELFLVPRRGALVLLPEQNPIGEPFGYDPHTGLLRAGALGLFEAEDDVLRPVACETDFSLNSPSQEDNS